MVFRWFLNTKQAALALVAWTKFSKTSFCTSCLWKTLHEQMTNRKKKQTSTWSLQNLVPCKGEHFGAWSKRVRSYNAAISACERWGIYVLTQRVPTKLGCSLEKCFGDWVATCLGCNQFPADRADREAQWPVALHLLAEKRAMSLEVGTGEVDMPCNRTQRERNNKYE